MAVKAICVLNGTVGRFAGDHTKCYVGVNYAVLDDSDPAIEGTTYLYNLTPSASLNADIVAATKAFLIDQGVVFGGTDTVQLLGI